MPPAPHLRPAAPAPGRCALPRRGALALAVLAVLAACTPAAPPPAPTTPAPAARPDRLRPVPPPPVPQVAAATPASLTMTQYLASVQDALVTRGQLRTDSGAAEDRLTPETLAENFVQIALRDEYIRQDGQLIPHSHAAPLRRWTDPVRLAVEFGASVPRGQRAGDQAQIASFAARLSRVTRHPVGVAPSGNFIVLVVAEDERASIGPRLSRLIPGIPTADLAAIESLSPQTYCTVFAYSRGSSAAYANAVAVIRAELPDRLRLSCIHEELAQGMGLANDSPTARPSIFNDDEEFAYLTGHDELLLQMLYDPRLRPGMTEAEARPVALAIAAELLTGTPPGPAT
ncbi:DUF2927 domain-containing protein [Paracoccus luteus]|uniref:DUF2927 domain-containing protein n=1 Tax=Paracoccus luteus TaxID=2508543 RepID=UPI00106F0DA6|nr:DUF2927 domain-containing protein [Paracoccus luteus]